MRCDACLCQRKVREGRANVGDGKYLWIQIQCDCEVLDGIRFIMQRLIQSAEQEMHIRLIGRQVLQDRKFLQRILVLISLSSLNSQRTCPLTLYFCKLNSVLAFLNLERALLGAILHAELYCASAPA